MRLINVAMDLYSSLICIILVTYLYVKSKKGDKVNIYFMSMCISNLGMLLGDIANWTCEGFAEPWYPFVLKLGTTIFYCCSATLLFSFTGYVTEYLSEKVKVRKEILYVSLLFTTIHLICSFMSLYNGMFFSIGADNIYRRGNLFWLSQLIPFIIYIISLGVIVTYRKYLRFKEIVFMVTYVALPLIAEVIQILNYGLALVNTAATVSILLVFINIQSERELLLSRQENALVKAQISLMKNQINPHFIYNTLSAIRQLCGQEPKQAKLAIGEFARYLRVNMDFITNESAVPFEQELSHVQTYLKLEKRRLKERLKVVYDIKSSNFDIPPLTIQPIVENAVQHGIAPKIEGGTVTIRAEETDEAYIITVSDDGVGFSPDNEQNDGRTHIGIYNVQRRLKLLCRGSVDISSSTDVGTTATIYIPKGGIL